MPSADELVDDALVVVDDAGGRAVEARHQAGELLGLHALGDAGRAADVREHDREVDLGAPGVLVHRARDNNEPQQRPLVLRALSRLSEPDREALLLVAWDGLSTAEGAIALGCSQTAFKVRLHRARRRLRSELGRLERDRPRPVVPSRLEECHDE